MPEARVLNFCENFSRFCKKNFKCWYICLNTLVKLLRKQDTGLTMRWQESCYDAGSNQGKWTGPLKKHEFCDWQTAEACLTQLVHIQTRVDFGFVFLKTGSCLHWYVVGKTPRVLFCSVALFFFYLLKKIWIEKSGISYQYWGN